MENSNDIELKDLNDDKGKEEDESKYKKLYFRRAKYKSELGDADGAIQDFTKHIEENPLDGQSYFQRGLEKYWTNRKSACQDMKKGLKLGAEDNSYLLINDKDNPDSFLEELFDKEETLIGTCKDVVETKLDKNKDRYAKEQLRTEGIELLKKYALVIPIFLIVILSIVVKYTSKDNNDN